MKILSTLPRVQISLIKAYTTHNDMLRGILDYVRSHAQWDIDLRTGRRDEVQATATDWRTCDGIIVNQITKDLLRLIRARRLPAVLVSSGTHPGFPGCVLSCDNAPIVSTAARHLLSRDCASYAFVGVPGMPWSLQREQGFAKAIRAQNARCFRWMPSDRGRMLQQLAEAPKPLGVFAADDVRAREVLDCCRIAGCAVPDEVAILGVDNDETLCEMSSPTLSSIPLSTRTAAYRAAEILDQALRGARRFDRMPDVTYTGDTVVERRSTARSFAKDLLVRRCRDLIDAQFTAPLRVSDLAKALNVSRRTLETHYRAVTGSSINADILARRIDKAKHLLADTAQRQEDIAVSCGFCDASHLGAIFRRHEGKPPSAFRGAQS